MVGEKAGLKSIITRRGEVSGAEMEGRNARGQTDTRGLGIRPLLASLAH